MRKKFFNKNVPILQKRALQKLEEYIKYLKEQHIINDRIAIIDMTTGAFSSQAFLTNFFKEKIILGLFCASFMENAEFKYKTFINTKLNSLDIPKINILELIFTAPELPLKDFKNLKPVYKTPTKADLFRLKIFPEIENGILNFANLYKEIFGNFQITITAETAFQIFDIITKSSSKIDKYYLKKVDHSADINNKNFKTIYSDLKLLVVLKRRFKNFIMNSKKHCKQTLIDKYKFIKFLFYEMCKP